MRQVFRAQIPVDGQWHTIQVRGHIVHVATRAESYVEIWFIHDTAITHWERTFRVFGTGQPDVEGAYVGTAITPSATFVWHLFESERTVPDA